MVVCSVFGYGSAHNYHHYEHGRLSDVQVAALYLLFFAGVLIGYVKHADIKAAVHDAWLSLVFTIARKRLDRDHDRKTKR